MNKFRLVDMVYQTYINNEELHRLVSKRNYFCFEHDAFHVLVGAEYTNNNPNEERYFGEAAVTALHRDVDLVIKKMNEDHEAKVFRRGVSWNNACWQVAAILPKDCPQREALVRLSFLGTERPTTLALRGLRMEFFENAEGRCDNYWTRPPTTWERVQDYTVNLVHDARRGLISRPTENEWHFDSLVDRLGYCLQSLLHTDKKNER